MHNIKHIWKKVLKGDRQAQQALYDYSCDDLMNVCSRYLADDSSHFDAMQEAYIKIFTKSKAYDPCKGTLDAWMARIAVNECLQILRKQKRLILVDVKDTNREPRVIEDVYSAMTTLEIFKEVQALSPGYRAVFNLYVVEGYSHNEVGEMLNISPSASRSQLTRAKMILKQRLKKKTISMSYEEAR